MANTYVDYTAVAAQTDYNFSFEYLRDEHVKVKVNGVETSDFTIVTSPVQLIRFNTAPAAGASIKIYRDSRGDFSPLVDFVDGSILTENELDESYKHNLFIGQEASEGQGGEQLTKKGLEHYDAEGNKIINLFAPSDNTDAANKGYVDDSIDTAIALGGSPAIVSLGGYGVTAFGSTTQRSLANRFSDVVNVLDYIPVSLHAGIRAKTENTPVDSYIQNALNTKAAVFIPGGRYVIANTLNPHKQQIITGEGNVQRGFLSEPNVTTIQTDSDITAFDTMHNVAIGFQLKRMNIVNGSPTTGSGTCGVAVGESGSTSGDSQGIKIKLEDIRAYAFDICFGIYGSTWEITLERCFADRPRTSGFEVENGVTISSLIDCSVVLAGVTAGSSPTNSAADSFVINGSHVYLYNPRAENSQDTGFVISGDARVVINNIYSEGNRQNDFILSSAFSGTLIVNGGHITHDNAGVATFSCIKNLSTVKHYLKFEGVDYSLGAVENNTIQTGFYYSESNIGYQNIEGLRIKSDVSKMDTSQVVYLSQSGRYAPSEFSVTDFSNVKFYRSGTSHTAHITGSLPATLNISDGTNTFDLLTNGSTGEVGGIQYIWSSAKSSWARLSNRDAASTGQQSSDATSQTLWWGNYQGTEIYRLSGQSGTQTVVIDTTDMAFGATFFVRTYSSVVTPATITVNDHNGASIDTITPSFTGAGGVVVVYSYRSVQGEGTVFRKLYQLREN